MILSIIGLVLAIFYFFIVLFFLRGWLRLPVINEISAGYKTKVSIIVAVRNEADNIEELISDLLSQRYPKELTEIIIIDDHSTDDTADRVRKHESEVLKLLQLQEDKPLNSYKKKAITKAISKSAGDLIITTDGDCRMGPDWVTGIVSFYEKRGYEFISAPVCFYGEKNWFEKLQSLEFMYLIGVGGSSIQNGSPNTCNGANLAYKRSLFDELNGFQDIDHLASGDDELFLHKVVERYPEKIGFLKSEQAIVYTHPKRTLDEFVSQRKRWASKSMQYKNRKISFLVILVWLFNLSLPLACIGGFFEPGWFHLLLIQLIFKFSADGAFLWAMSGFFRKREQMKYFPAVEFFYTFYIILIGIYGNFGGKYTWKGREVQ